MTRLELRNPMHFARLYSFFKNFASLRENIKQFYYFRDLTSQWKWKTILEKTCKRCLIMKESHIYKGSLDTFISTIIKHICMSGLVSSECRAALIVASLGPGAGCEGGGIVTRHTLHSALRANCSPAAAGLHEMTGHSDTQCKTEIRRDISNSFLRDEYFIQPIICFAKLRALCWHFHFRFVLLRGVHFVYVTLCLYSLSTAAAADIQYSAVF